MKHHVKHSKIPKPTTGLYSRNEFTILGTTCGKIEHLVRSLETHLGEELNTGYMDADHSEPSSEELPERNSHYTNNIQFHTFRTRSKPDSLPFRAMFNDLDLLFVNGNHFDGDQQLVVIDGEKFSSLQKRIKRLSNVRAFLLKGDAEIPDFIRENVADWQNIPALRLQDHQSVASLIREHLVFPKVRGLVLAGGRSIRMGTDKGQINYHGRPQVELVYDLLNEITSDALVSYRPGQEIPNNMRSLEDSFLGLGPFGAILSALQSDPDSAWLTLAVDMPFVDRAAIEHLVHKRNAHARMTCYINPDNNLPEPLFCIWEPSSYLHLLTMMSMGITCPRKSIIKSESKMLVKPEDHNIIRNINTPEDLAEAQKDL